MSLTSNKNDIAQKSLAPDYCLEFYTIEKTIEMVIDRAGTNQVVRIEALKNEKAEPGEEPYVAKGFIQTEVDGKRVFQSWHGMPWAYGATADLALRHVLGHIYTMQSRSQL